MFHPHSTGICSVHASAWKALSIILQHSSFDLRSNFVFQPEHNLLTCYSAILLLAVNFRYGSG
jgi:hypothetical protein